MYTHVEWCRRIIINYHYNNTQIILLAVLCFALDSAVDVMINLLFQLVGGISSYDMWHLAFFPAVLYDRVRMECMLLFSCFFFATRVDDHEIYTLSILLMETIMTDPGSHVPGVWVCAAWSPGIATKDVMMTICDVVHRRLRRQCAAARTNVFWAPGSQVPGVWVCASWSPGIATKDMTTRCAICDVIRRRLRRQCAAARTNVLHYKKLKCTPSSGEIEGVRFRRKTFCKLCVTPIARIYWVCVLITDI